MTRKAMLPLMFLMLLMVPAAQCFTINNPDFNFVNSHGGNVRFGDVFTTTQNNVANTLNRFLSLVFGGTNYGTLSFDCDTGVNMTIISVSQYTVIYNVSTAEPGAVNTYVSYARNDNAPTGTNTDTVTYNAATNIATVTTTGNGVLVTLDYATVGSLLAPSINIMIYFIPIIAMLVGLEANKQGIIGNRLFVFVALIAALAVVAGALRLLGY